MTGLHRDDQRGYSVSNGEATPEVPERIAESRRTGKWLVGLGIALLIVLAVAVIAWLRAQSADAAAQENGQRVTANAERANERDRLLQAQIDQFERCIGKPRGTPGCTIAVAPEPEDLPDPVSPVPVPVPPPPPDLLTEGDVRAIVGQVLVEHESELSDAQIERVARVAAGMVPKPKDGVSPSEAQVRAIVTDVVAAVCANDACRGEDGEDGEDGDDAPPVSDEQLDARIAAYCAARPDGDCDGENGRDGTNGVDGRGLVDLQCVDDTTDAGSHWLLTWSREPVETTIPGPCRVKQPAPTSSPEPTEPPTE